MILTTKLNIPNDRHEILIERPFLIQSLNEGLKMKLTVVTAPAGYGKTSSLSQWVHQCKCSAVWISLDQFDNDLVQFWSYIVASIERANPNFDLKITRYLESLRQGAYETFISQFLNGLNATKSDLVIILDDYHVIELASIHNSIAYMLEYLPAHIHLYIASRTNLPFPMARLQAKGQIHKIIVQDLRFQLDEGIRYFRDCMTLPLSDEDISFLINRTEGWVSGLHLVALSLKRSENPSSFIRDFSGQHRDIGNYLMEELLQRQTKEVRDFLMQTSLLRRMNSSLCEVITGEASCQEKLEELEHQNMFIIPIDDQGEWYRYHHLFADYLQQQFQRKYPNRWDEAHANAASWFEDNGFLEEAVEHFIIGHHYLEAASLMEKNLQKFELKPTVLHHWMNLLPDSVLALKPVIQCLYIKILIDAGEMVLAETLLRSIQDKLTEPDWKPWSGSLFLMFAQIALLRGDLQKTWEYIEIYEHHFPEGSPYQMIGGNTAQGINFDILLSLINNLHSAEDFFLKLIKIWEKKESYPFIGFIYVSYGELLYEWNRLEEAEDYLDRALFQKQMQPYARILVHAAIGGAKIRQAKGDVEGAIDLLEKVKSKIIRSKIHEQDKSLFVMELEAEKVYMSLLKGSKDDAFVWIKSYALKSSDSIPLYSIRIYLHFARALMTCDQVNEAMILLDRLFQLVNQEDRLRDKIKVLILQSMVLYQKEDTLNALMKLEFALNLAEPHGYILSFVNEGSDLANLLAQYLHNRQHNFIRQSLPVSLSYVKKLLYLMDDKVNEDLVLPPLLTQQETKILLMVQEGLMNRQIAERINVSTETVKMHLKNIYRKLEVNSRLQAIQRGKELNLL